jgi:hypothetical protein
MYAVVSQAAECRGIKTVKELRLTEDNNKRDEVPPLCVLAAPFLEV